MNEAEYNEFIKRLEAEENQGNADEFWGKLNKLSDDGIDNRVDGSVSGDKFYVKFDPKYDVCQHEEDILNHSLIEFEEELAPMINRFKRTFGGEQPATPRCYNHCVN